MPSRNIVKVYDVGAYYHVYNRGVNKQDIFKDKEDCAVFLNLLKRYLDVQPTKDKQGREYMWLHKDVELLAFCLMPNHFHLLVYQKEMNAITQLLRGVSTAYTMYFNKKYKRVGHLFQDIFKASRVLNDSYLQHISRYIHLNLKDFMKYEFSSLPYYLDKKHAGWVNPDPILALFDSRKQYINFLKEHDAYKKSLEILEDSLV